jgi:hypothetical protein
MYRKRNKDWRNYNKKPLENFFFKIEEKEKADKRELYYSKYAENIKLIATFNVLIFLNRIIREAEIGC